MTLHAELCPGCSLYGALVRTLIRELDAGDVSWAASTLESLEQVAAAPLPGPPAGPPQHDAATPGRRHAGGGS